MSTDKFCPLQTLLPCGPKCGFYLKLDKRCSINLIAEALISLVNLKGNVFPATIKKGGRITIPFDIRKESNLEDGDSIKVVVIKEEK